jgi:hypothetical protein
MDANQLLKTVSNKNSQPKKGQSDKSFDNVMESISKNWKDKPDHDEIIELREKLNQAKIQIQELKKIDTSLTKNEEKVINAIRSESLNQNTETPLISYNKFRKLYKVSSSYYRPSIESLLRKNIITKEKSVFSGKVITYKWKIIIN